MTTEHRELTGAAMVGFAACLWGTWSLFLRPAGLPAATSGVLVFAVMGVSTLPAAWRAAPPRWDRTTAALLAGNSLLDAGNVLTFFAALRITTVAVAVLTHYLAPVLIAIAAPAIDRQRVPGAVPAALVACAGLAVVLAPWQAGGHDALAGGALGAASAVCYASNVFVVRRLAARIGAARTISYHSFGAAVAMAPLAIAAGVVPGGRGLAWIGGAALVLGSLAGVAFVRGLAIIGSARAAMLAYFEPVVAVGVGAAAWGEPLGARALTGAALVIASGVWLARRTPM